MSRVNLRLRPCSGCGRTFSGDQNRCRACRTVTRPCTRCGRVFRGTQTMCYRCRGRDRVCVACGAEYHGRYKRCPSCMHRYAVIRAAIAQHAPPPPAGDPAEISAERRAEPDTSLRAPDQPTL